MIESPSRIVFSKNEEMSKKKEKRKGKGKGSFF